MMKKHLLILCALSALTSSIGPPALFTSALEPTIAGWSAHKPQREPQVEQGPIFYQPEERRNQKHEKAQEQKTNMISETEERTMAAKEFDDNNNEPQKKHDEAPGLIRAAAKLRDNYEADDRNALTLNRQERGAALESAASSSDEPATNSIQALVGRRLVLPCSNLTADQLSRSSSSSPSTTTTTTSNQSNARRQPQQQPHQAGPSQQRSRQPASAAAANGIVSLIVWHKDDPQLSSPIFTIDARGSAGNLREARQQTYADWLKGRAHFEESAAAAGFSSASSAGQTPALVIDEALQVDAGLYTCTVEFNKAPTQTYQIRVNLIDPPHDMVIRDSESAPAGSLTGAGAGGGAPQIIGPFDENSRLSLVCELDAGKPASQVSWWQLSSVTSIPKSVVVSTRRQQQQQQRQQQSPTVVITSNSLANFDYLTTMVADDAGRSAMGANLFVGLHSRPFRGEAGAVDDDIMGLVPLIGDGGQKLKHWNRVKDISLSIDDKIQATLQLSPLSRAHQGAEFLCMANNNQLALPLNSSVILAMNLKPNEVKIMDKSGHTFRLGEKIMIECQVHGSRPRAQVRWFKDKQQLSQHNAPHSADTSSSTSDNNGYLISDINTSTTNNFTQISYLTFVPQLSDNMRTLSCVANNPSMSDLEPLSDSIVMNVQYPPQLRLQLGAGLRDETIKVGNDVFMECNIESNPPIDDLSWHFNDQPVYANVSAGMIISNQSLVLQRIRVEQRGKYQCAAQNLVGRSMSNQLDLRPKFEPICDYSLTKTRYEVAVNQQIRVACNVLAEPNDDLHFVWKFNQSSRNPSSSSADLSSSAAAATDQQSSPYWMEDIKQYETNFTSSYAIFSPKSRRQYGQLLCYASNSMGKQSKPCVISVVPPELPDPVFSCFFDGITNTSFSVYCQAPDADYSGNGLGGSGNNNNGRHTYLLEVFESLPAPATTTTSSNKSSGATAQSSQHLKQQRQDQSALAAAAAERPAEDLAATNFDEQPNNNDKAADDGAADQPAAAATAANIRLTRSDSPSFHVTDLSPATQYTVTVYVQNSKGRSRPISYPISTADSSSGSFLSSAASSSSSSGRVQFQNKRLSTGAGAAEPTTSLADRLISYLRVDDYLSRSVNSYYSSPGGGAGDQTRPLLAIVVLVLLSSCTIIVVAFFVTRLCGRRTGGNRTAGAATASGQGKSQKKRRGKNRIWSSSNSLERSLGTKLSTYAGIGKQPPQLERPTILGQQQQQQQQQIQLTPAHSSSCSSSAGGLNRLKALAGVGSGSDTSRETNTDSTTLISSSASKSNNCQMIESAVGVSARLAAATTIGVSTVSGGGVADDKMVAPAAVRSSRESLYAAAGKSPLMMMMRPVQSASVSEQQHRLRGLYSTINRQQQQHNGSPHLADAGAAHSETPQMSIQSDCSTSTNTGPNNADLLMQVNPHSLADHNHQHHQELQIAAMSVGLEQHRRESNPLAGGSYYIKSVGSTSNASSNFVVPPACSNNRMVAGDQNCPNSPMSEQQQQQQSIRLVGSKGAGAAVNQASSSEHHRQQQNLGFAGWAYLGDPTMARMLADNRSGNGSFAGETQVDLTTANLAYGNGNANACNHHSLGGGGSGGGSGCESCLLDQTPIPAGFLPSSSSIPVSLSECQHLHLAEAGAASRPGGRDRHYSQEFLHHHSHEPDTGRHSYLTLAPAGLLADAEALQGQNDYRQQQQQQQLAEYRPASGQHFEFGCVGGGGGADQQQHFQIQDLSQPFITYVSAEPEHALCAGRASVDAGYHDQHQLHNHRHHHHQCQTLDNSFRQSWRAGQEMRSASQVGRNSFDRTSRQHGRPSGQRVKFNDQQTISGHQPQVVANNHQKDSPELE